MATNDNNNRKNTNKHLFYLNELSDYKVSSDDPDVRGWEVKDRDNRVIGTVDNLLVNKNTERVVYLDVEVDSSIIEANHDPYGQPANDDVKEFINKEGENHIIIPVGLVSLNEDQNFVYTDRIDHQTFAETKRIAKGANVNREYEVVVLDSYDRDNRRTGDDQRTNTENRTIVEGTSLDDRGSGRDEKRSDSDVSRTGKSFGDTETGRTTEDRSSFDSTGTEDQNSRSRSTGEGPSDRYSRERRDTDTDSTGDIPPRDSSLSDRDKDRGSKSDDDSFYERREFERRNYRSNKD